MTVLHSPVRAHSLFVACASAVLIGALIGHGYLGSGSKVSLEVLGALAVSLAVVVWRIVVVTTIVVLTAGVTDSLPGPELNGYHAGPGKTTYIVVGLVLLLAWAGRRNLRLVPAWLWMSSVALFIWWLTSVMRAWAVGAPAGAILKSAADLGSFALLLPVFVATFLDDRMRRRLIVGFTFLTAWVAVGNVAASLGAIPGIGGFWAHAYRATPAGGIFRIYALSAEIPAAALPFALGAVLLATTRRARAVAALILLACSTEVLLSLTRAQYVGTAAMVSIMLVLWGRRYVRRVLALTAVATVLVAGAAHSGPLVQPIHQMTARVGSIFQGPIQRQSGLDGDTLAYRTRYEAAIRASMSTSDWMIGRGFLPSPWYRFTPDANGDLRNSDLGWYNALNTMGLIGVFLVFAPVVLVALVCWRARRKRADLDWLAFGGMGYAIYALVVSQTLVTLFSLNGLTCAAAALGLGLAGSLRAMSNNA